MEEVQLPTLPAVLSPFGSRISISALHPSDPHLGVVKHGEKPEVFPLRNWIIFVGVALGASHRSAHPDRHGRVHPVYHRGVAESSSFVPPSPVRHGLR